MFENNRKEVTIMANVLNLQADTVDLPQDAKGCSDHTSILWCACSVSHSAWMC